MRRGLLSSGLSSEFNERAQPDRDLSPCSPESLQLHLFGALELCRIVQAPVQRVVVSREDWAGLPGPIADRDHVVERLSKELSYRFGLGSGPVDTDLTQDGIWLRAELPVQTNRTRIGSTDMAEDAVARALGIMGARIILSPCAWAVPSDYDNRAHPYGHEWRDHYGRIAKEFRLSIVGVSNVGPITAGAWAGRQCIGSSLAVGPNGTPLAEGPYGVDAEALIRVELELLHR